MSAAVYREPYRLPAGLLALAVHGLFFALLFFGFTWQKQPPATMSVELWQSLPEIAPEAKPAVRPPPLSEAEPQPKPEPQKIEAKPEIALPDEKKKPEPKPAEQKPVEKKVAEPAPPVVSEAERQAERERAERVAAIGRVVDEYTAKIATKIRGRIVMPPDVPDSARAEFRVTVLPGGSVLKAELKKSSGHTAYDSAVERAIFKAQPLPLPPDAALFNRFRELNLGFQPKE